MRRDKKEVRSGQEAGFSAEPTRIGMQSSPLSLDETARKTSAGRRIVGVLASGLGRRSSSPYSPTDSPNSPSLLVKRHFAFPILAVLAVAALGLWLLLPGGALRAQDEDGPIKYAENDTGAVATFTAVDPEEKDITWSLSGTDAEDFKIDDGVLTFSSKPNYEAPADNDTDNTYEVSVVASARADDTDAIRTVTRAVTVEVTNVEEAGSIMLSTLQPQVGVQVTATLNDADTRDADGNTETITATWQWYRGSIEIPGATTANFTPSSGDVGFVLVVKASYDDAEDKDKSAEQTSAHPVRAAPASNIAPVFPDEAVADNDVLIKPREVDENTASGENIGAPIAATDPGDVLTYAFAGEANNAGEALFDIDRATGQLMTKDALNHEAAGGDSYTVTVTATDPFGVPAVAPAVVTIEVADVNEAPTITRTPTPPAAVISFAELNETTSLPTYEATDVDREADNSPSDTLTWSKTGTDAGKFNIGNQTEGTPGQLTFSATPNYESPGDADGDNDYEVTVVVSDGKGNSDEHDVTVSVTNVEEDGEVTISTLQPRVGVELTADLTDPDDDINGLMWQWYRDDNLALDSLTETECEDATSDECLIEDAASAAYTPIAGDIGHSLNAVATYKDGSGTTEDMAFAEAAADVIADRRPKAPVFPDQDMEMDGDQTDQEREVPENYATGDNYSQDPTFTYPNIGALVAATDPNPGDTLTYTLGGTDAASFAIVAADGQLQRKAALDHEDKDSYSVTVTATDSLGLTATVNVAIKVADVDEVPELEGDNSAMYAENGTGSVATFTATDPEEKDIDWTLSGSDVEDFSIDGGVLEFDSPPDFENGQGTGTGGNEYVVTVEASAGAEAAVRTATLAVTVTVTDVDEPGTITFSTLQPQAEVEVTATLSDGDGPTGTVMWRWFRGGAEIAGSASSGQATAGQATATYTPAEGDAGQRLRAVASYTDGHGEDKTAQGDSSRAVRRAPTSNVDPQYPEGPVMREVAENTAAERNIGAPVVATDPNDVLTYTLDTTGAVTFSIDRATGQLKTKAALDHEGESSYSVTVTATDPFGPTATASATVTITVTDVNEAPEITDSPAAVLTFAENAAITSVLTDYAADDEDMPDDTLTWSLTGADAGKFSITPGADQGVLTFKASPDFETPGDADRDNDYELTVVVSDGKGNSDEHDVTVSVTDAMETGTVTFSTLQPRVGVELTAELDDPDDSITGLMWAWSRRGTDFVDDDRPMLASYTPVADDIGATLTATATYKDGESGTDERMVTANPANSVIADTRNKAPTFPDQDPDMDGDQTDQERSVDEGAAPAANANAQDKTIGPPVTAEDDQYASPTSRTPGPDTLTYTLGGTDAASFDILPGTGQLQRKAALDFEAKPTYTVEVTATDPSGLSATVTVTIEVDDVDEAPEIMVGGLAISGTTRVDYAENRRDAVATYTASGPDASMATWSLEGDDAGDFRISNRGVLTFRSAPDYETKSAYMVTVKADDGTYTAMRNVTVRVTTDAVVVVPVTDGTLLERYDTNPDNGKIDRDEVLDAIDDFFDPTNSITREEVLDVIDLFFVGLSS